jgi:hypothetical protein
MQILAGLVRAAKPHPVGKPLANALLSLVFQYQLSMQAQFQCD